MAVRRESVRLDLEGNFTTEMATAAAATAVLNHELHNVDGTRLTSQLRSGETEVKRFGDTTKKSSADLNDYTGRLGLLADSIITLGPALVPLAEGALPALTGALNEVGAGAAGIGVMVLALHGLQDGIKTLNAYRLDPTIANLDKLRQTEAQLGPAGTEFLHFIGNLEPQLKQLQFLARAGFLPGLQNGIDELLTRLPLARQLISGFSAELGHLSEEAGASLASPKWAPFFSMLKHDGVPTLDALAHTAGNVALGLVNMLEQFAPASRSFDTGLEKMSERFVTWSQNLDQNQGFQNFLADIRVNAPQDVALLESLAKTFLAITEATAPIGREVLPVLTDVSNIVGDIAGSDLGTPLLAGLVIMRLYARTMQGIDTVSKSTFGRMIVGQKQVQAGFIADGSAARVFAADLGNVARYGNLATESSGRLKGQLGTLGRAGLVVGGLALATSDLSGKFALADTASYALTGSIAGPWGAAIGAGVGLAEDFAKANNSMTDAINRANNALETTDTRQQRAALDALDQQLAKTDKALSQNPFKQAFQLLTGNTDEWAASADVLTGADQKARAAQDELSHSISNTRALAKLLAPTIGEDARQLYDASHAAQDYAKSLARVNDWLSYRDAIAAYKKDLAGLAKGFKDGFTSKDADNIRQFGHDIVQVASTIKNVGDRNTYLAGARSSLEELARHSGPAASAALKDLIHNLDKYGLTKPPPPKLDADTSGVKKATNSSRQLLDELVGKKYQAKITADGGQAIVTARQVAAAIAAVRDKTVHINIQTVHTDVSGVGYQHGLGHATGGRIAGPGGPTDDQIPAWLSNGEYVIRAAAVDRYGPGFFDQLNAMHFADGGATGGKKPPAPGRPVPITDFELQFFNANLLDAAKGLKTLKAESDAFKSALDKAKSAASNAKDALQSIKDERASYAQSVAGTFQHDPFGNGLAGFNAQVSADTSDAAAMVAVLKDLVQNKGLDPHSALFKALAASGDLQTAQQLDALTSSQVFAEQNSYATLGSTTGALGQYGGAEVFNQQIAKQTHIYDQLQGAVHDLARRSHQLEQAISKMGKHVQEGAHSGSQAGSAAGSRAGSEAGSRAGIRDRDGHATALVRTGGR